MHRYDTKFLKIFGEFFGNTAKEEQRKPVQEKFNVLRSIIIRVEYILRWRCFPHQREQHVYMDMEIYF